MALKRLIGSELLIPTTNELVSSDDFILLDENYIIGFYLVSGNCPQCVDFSKHLLTFYETRLESQVTPRLKMISVSLEEDEETFKQSLQNLPWPALPRTAARHKKARLLRRLRLPAVAPALALVEAPSGRLVTSAARERLLQDPESFPWQPRALSEALAAVHLRGSSEDTSVKYQELQGVKGFYFSANWCPPCKAFTPQLAETYQQVRGRGQDFEVIFVSSDRSEASFQQYLSSMPWLAVPFELDALRRELAATLGVQGIPSLVLLDEHDHIITDEARAELIEDPEGKSFPWPARRVSPLNERTAVRLQDRPALVLLVESEEDLEFAEGALQPAASEYWETRRDVDVEDDEDELLFFVGCDSETSDALREFAGLEDCVPLLALLDVTSQRVATLEEGAEVSVESVRRFVGRHLAGQLVWAPLAPCTPATPEQNSPCTPALPPHAAPSSSAAPC